MIDIKNINFGPDKSLMLRGVGIIFMIFLHNGLGGLFKICVPIFTFLVGYGYAFARTKDLSHAAKRSWHLLSHFWLILLGFFVPVSIWKGNWTPNMPELLANMFGLESKLNWYSWYIYFYIYAIVAMIPASRIICRFGMMACFVLTIACFGAVGAIHLIPNYSDNIWFQAIHDCFLCSPVMFTGYYLAEKRYITKMKIQCNFKFATLALLIMCITYFVRAIPGVSYIDFIVVPAFCTAAVALFNIITLPILDKFFMALGKESMNMWFIHALFATSYTSIVFAPLIMWIEPLLLRAVVMIALSYILARLCTAAYNSIASIK